MPDTQPHLYPSTSSEKSSPTKGLGFASLWRRPIELLRNGNPLLLGALLFGLVIWTFLPSLRGEFIDYDDRIFITENSHTLQGVTLKSLGWAFSAYETCNWHPLTWWSHILDYQLYGRNPWGHHLTNVLIHGLNTLLIFFGLRTLTGATWRSLIVALLFSLHPLRVESVAWISERKDVLSTMFGLLSLWAYACYAKVRSPKCEVRGAKDEVGNSKFEIRNSKLAYALSLFFFALALMCKAMLVTLPFVFLLLDYWPLGRMSGTKRPVSGSVGAQGTASTLNSQLLNLSTLPRLVAEKIPFFILIPVVSVLTLAAQEHWGSLSELLPMSLGVRLANALVSYARYLGKLFWPVDLCALYPHPGLWPVSAIVLASLVMLAISAVALALWKRSPYLLVGWLWFLGTLVPVIGLVQEGPQAMADRYSYLPCIGLLIMLVWGVAELKTRWRHRSTALGVAVAAAALVCIVLTRHQIGFWKDDIAVWSRALDVTPDSFAAELRLGRALGARKRYDEAIPHLQESIRMRPDYNAGEARYYLGGAFLIKERPDLAIAEYEANLKLPDVKAGLAHYKIGLAYSAMHRPDDALVHFETAVAADPQSAVYLSSLGLLLMEKGRTDQALDCLRKAIEVRPEAGTHQNLGMALLQVQRGDEAAVHFRKVLEFDPRFAIAHNALGLVSLQKGQPAEAVPHFQKAAECKPDFAIAYYHLGVALLTLTNAQEANRSFQKAVELRPNWFEAHLGLGYSLLHLGRLDDGIVALREATRLNPRSAEAQGVLAQALEQKELLLKRAANSAQP